MPLQDCSDGGRPRGEWPEVPGNVAARRHPRRIVRRPGGRGASTLLAKTALAPSSIAVDERFVYVTLDSATEGAIVRIEK
jgi:hypothetical protein